MFFQINVTPKEKKPSKPKQENGQEEIQPQEDFRLVLAPFQPQVHIKLQTTVFNSTKCRLIVQNSSNKNLNVTIAKAPPPERCVTLSASELSVQAESDAELEITWTPQEAGSWRDTLQLMDNRRIKYDVVLMTTARETKKPSKGKPRILGPANTNRNSTRNYLTTVQREMKKNIQASYSGQPVVPSKRPRLNAEPLNNKENVSKTFWTCSNTEIKESYSTNSHDFSAIMNSTKFTLTPLKSNNNPDIIITEEVDFSSQRGSTVLPETPSTNSRRQTYFTEKTFNIGTTSHEFSLMMNSSNFNFTPIKPQGIEEQRKQTSHTREKVSFSPQDAGIVSPEISNPPKLRRETYVARKNMITTIEENEGDENFEDSLSPEPETNVARKQFEFSAFINEMNLLTPKGPNSGQGLVFSPKGCSTENRTKQSEGRLLSVEGSPSNTVANSTFDISNPENGSNSKADGTYELITSPTCSKNGDPIKPTRLSKTFETPPHVSNPASDRTKQSPCTFSSTAVCSDAFSTRSEYSTRSRMSRSYKGIYDDASVKEVLEANLWVDNEKPPEVKRSSSFSTITCETPSSRPVFLAPLDKTQALPGKPKFRQMQISPPKRLTTRSKTDLTRRVSPTKGTKVRKEKDSSQVVGNMKKKVQLNCTLRQGQVSIPGVRIANLSLAGLSRSNVKGKSGKVEPKEVSVKLHDANDFVTRFCNPDPFGATMTQDPFLTSTLYYDEEWMHHQEMEFKKWLNALMTPPEQLDADVDTIRVDVGKVWQSCRSREEMPLAETREAVSARYHTNTRLNTLRKAACAMFHREEITTALSKAIVCVERGTLMIRQDRDLHRDIGLQKEILELFLSYNPLWLRIGLETVYGETIPLSSNNDLVGLTRFLIARFFSDPFIVKTHSHQTTTSIKLPSFALHMNKFILKKFLLIVYFLDYAKRNKLIGHDPCLFHKRGSHKDSRSILLTFSRELLSGVGDVTKVLRSHGYVVSHKQTYLDEYDYAVKELSTDLRDGVRLCRVMELISGNRNLACRCRVPAISRLQKIHNVDLALSALRQCGYTLKGDIDAKSIADGHREKTLSLLWQIIFKYQAPRFDKAGRTIQRWWRAALWYIRVRNFLRDRRDNAAATIQRAWRCHRARRILNELRDERNREWARKEGAVRTIQIHWIRRARMLKDRREFLEKRDSAKVIQRWFLQRRATAPFVSDFRAKRRAIETIQRRWRARSIGKAERARYLRVLESVRKIQAWWKAGRSARQVLVQYRALRKAAVLVQTKWRALKSMRIARDSFLEKLIAARIIQAWWRRYLLLKRDRNDYLLKKNAVRTIEDWLMGWKNVRVERARFRKKRVAAVLIQRRFRRYLQTRDHVEYFRRSTRACRVIQQWWRAVRIAKNYRTQKKSCLVVQRWWRGLCLTRSQSASFQNLRKAATILSKNWRARTTRRRYLRTKNAALTIESWYLRILLLRSTRYDFQRKKNAVGKLQIWWRSLKASQKQRQEYLQYRKAVIVVQRRWKANHLARETRLRYLETRRAIVRIQATWRMTRERKMYKDLLRREKAAKILQRRWRETLEAKRVRSRFLEYRAACTLVQTRYRELKLSREVRASYLRTRAATIVLQKNCRMLKVSRDFKKVREATLVLQARWRARKNCIEARGRFVALRETTLKLQRRYRANRKGSEVREAYLKLRSSAINIQNRWRAERSMREVRNRFMAYRRAVIVVQAQWRMIMQRRDYQDTRESILLIQSKWRALKMGRKTREMYNTQRKSILFVQRRFRANKLCKIQREEFAKTRARILWIQRVWRKKMETRMYDEAAIQIQTWWKSIIAMRKYRNLYLLKRSAVVSLQRRYRAFKIAQETRIEYQKTIRSVVTIQKCWRTYVERKRHEEWLRDCKSAALSIELWWMQIMKRKREREEKLRLLKRDNDAATKIQSAWRGYLVRKEQCAIMKELRQRSEKAAKAAVPTATVAFQLRESMDNLLACDTIGQLSMCLTSIDTLTRFSVKGCISFCEMNFVDKIYRTIAKSNRSIPWLDVCVRCTSILITLTKLSDTKKYVYRVEFIEILARLMTVAIDHHVDLFLHLATLLWLLAENPEFAQAITSCHRTTWLLNSLYMTISKKKSKISTGILNKSRGREQPAQLPNSKPDWGITHKRPRLFTTVHHAISSLMTRLKIDSET